MTKSAEKHVEFEPEFIAGLAKIFDELIPFNRVLGLKFISLKPDLAVGRIDMTPSLIGNYHTNQLHGGVISAGLDTMGGLAVFAAICARHMSEPPEQRLKRFGKMGTIDLRIDYLKPAIGEHFDLHARVLRVGSRVATAHMDFFAADGTLKATGTGVYIVA